MPQYIAWFCNDQPVAEAWPSAGQVRMRLHNGRRWGSAYGAGLWEPFEAQPFFVIFNLAFGSGVSLGAAKNIDQFRTDGELDRASLDWIRVWEL